MPQLPTPTVRVVQIDAFTDTPFRGNPAAVCLLDAYAADERLQDIAREMNLSETAFLVAQGDGYRLRWFTPVSEVDLCGHATLASAHFLWESGLLPKADRAVFETASGSLTASLENGLIAMDFPAEPAHAVELTDTISAAFPGPHAFVGKNRMDLLIVLERDDAVRDFVPDFERIGRLDVRGVILSARATDSRFDFVSRFFAPRLGVPEDPVTGSAHCCLGPYWSSELEKSEVVGRQLSPRGGTVQVECRGDRVHLKGHAVTVMRGEMVWP